MLHAPPLIMKIRCKKLKENQKTKTTSPELLIGGAAQLKSCKCTIYTYTVWISHVICGVYRHIPHLTSLTLLLPKRTYYPLLISAMENKKLQVIYWLLGYLPLWKKIEGQLRWLHSQYIMENKTMFEKQFTMIYLFSLSQSLSPQHYLRGAGDDLAIIITCVHGNCPWFSMASMARPGFS